MNKKIHIWDVNQTETNGMSIISATVEPPNGKISKLWYSFPAEYGCQAQENRMDAFVIATQLMAMNLGADLYVHGRVAPSLLRNLEEYRAIWACWRPSFYRPIDIKVDVEEELLRTEKPLGNIMAFSGGLDACFTAYRHATHLCGRQNRNIKAGVLVNFNVSPDNDQNFQDWAEKSRKILKSIGMEFIPVSTNLNSVVKTLEMRKNKLLDDFLPKVISSLMLFQKSYDAALIASGATYDNLSPWSTHPITDPLLSHNAFEIIHDGAAFTRTDKTRVLKDWPEALDNLYVCWKKDINGVNCGKCPKCIRTILNFRVVGAPLPGCFQEDISDRDILNQVKLGNNSLDSLKEILSEAEKASITDSWVEALRTCIQK